MKITDPSENKYLHGNLNFALGTSVPLNIFKDSLKIVKYAIESNFYIHTSINYPANAFIFKYFMTFHLHILLLFSLLKKVY